VDDRGIVAPSLAGARNFSALVNIPATSAVLPAFYSMGLSGSFVVGRAWGVGGVKLTPTSSLVPRVISGAVPPLVIALMRRIRTSSLYLCVLLDRRRKLRLYTNVDGLT